MSNIKISHKYKDILKIGRDISYKHYFLHKSRSKKKERKGEVIVLIPDKCGCSAKQMSKSKEENYRTKFQSSKNI